MAVSLVLFRRCGRVVPVRISEKGKEIANSENLEKWVERDFLNFREIGPNSSKRKVEDEEEEEENHKKNSKIEALNLSLALPDVSLSLTASNGVQRKLLRLSMAILSFTGKSFWLLTSS